MAAIIAAAGWTGAGAQTATPQDSLINELQEVVVTARQPATKLVGSTLVSVIPGTPLQNLGTALDVLAQLPMITVDNTTVGIIGKGSPEIYIDGHPMRDSDKLTRLQSSDLRKVELIMAPGAMYESSTKAVLKITTRRNFIKGLSLTDRATAEQKRRFSANNILDLNYRIGNWDLFASGTVGHYNQEIKGSTTNRLIYDGRPTTVGASQDNRYPTTVGAIRGGFNYADASQSFGGSYRYNPERGDFSNHGSEWLDDNPAIRRDIDRRIRAHSHLASVYYDRNLSENAIIHFDGDFKSSLSRTSTLTSYPDGTTEDVGSTDRRRSRLWAARLYLRAPLWQGDFTLGTQDSYTRTSLDYRMLSQSVDEYIPSSLTDARQTSLGAFASWDRSFGPFSLSAGLRYEYVDYRFKVNGRKDDGISRRDNLLTPDISLGYSFCDDAQLGVSYRMSTIKPPYSQLTGSLSYVGIHEIEGGNPALRDEHLHDIQLFGTWKGFTLQADYTRSLDTYAFVKRIYPAPTLQLLMQPINIDVSALDLYLVWNRNIRAWSPSLTLGMHRQWLEIDGTAYDKPIFSYYFDNMISLPVGFQLTLNANGQTRGDMHTNRFDSTWFTLNASVGKFFLDKALQLKLSATDIFNTLNNDWSMNTFGIRVDKRQSYDRRGVSLSVTYRFQPRKDRYKGKSAAEAEMKRL